MISGKLWKPRETPCPVSGENEKSRSRTAESRANMRKRVAAQTRDFVEIPHSVNRRTINADVCQARLPAQKGRLPRSYAIYTEVLSRRFNSLVTSSFFPKHSPGISTPSVSPPRPPVQRLETPNKPLVFKEPRDQRGSSAERTTHTHTHTHTHTQP